jgi:hypothetical protein
LIVIVTICYSGHHIKKNVIERERGGKVVGMGGEVRCTQGFSGETGGKETTERPRCRWEIMLDQI